MKFYNFLIALCVMFFAMSCSDEEDEVTTDTSGTGTVTLMFDNVMGDSDLVFMEDGTTETYNLTNALGQEFNLDLMGYYVSEITLSDTGDTEDYADEISISADEALGFYLIVENADGASNNTITLENVPAGHYTNLTFTLGVDFDYVEEGAQAGDLAQSMGYFWSWDNGYIGYKLEGTAAIGGEYSTETETLEESTDVALAYHIGGEGDDFSNIKTISLDLDTHLIVTSETNATIMLQSDVAKAMSGYLDVDFMTMPTGHAPSDTQNMARNLTSVFEVMSVDNDGATHAHVE